MVEQIVQCCFSLFGGGHGRRREDGGGKCVGAWVVLVVLVVGTGWEGVCLLNHGKIFWVVFSEGAGSRPGPQIPDIEDFTGKWSRIF